MFDSGDYVALLDESFDDSEINYLWHQKCLILAIMNNVEVLMHDEILDSSLFVTVIYYFGMNLTQD